MITLHIHYNNRTHYYSLSSLWAANLIAINNMKADANIKNIMIVDNETGEVYKNYVRE